MSRIFLKGCEAIAEAAVRSGCRFFAGYPITPQNEIPEYFARRMPEVGGTFVQGESEVASVNMVYGAAQTPSCESRRCRWPSLPENNPAARDECRRCPVPRARCLRIP